MFRRKQQQNKMVGMNSSLPEISNTQLYGVHHFLYSFLLSTVRLLRLQLSRIRSWLVVWSVMVVWWCVACYVCWRQNKCACATADTIHPTSVKYSAVLFKRGLVCHYSIHFIIYPSSSSWLAFIKNDIRMISFIIYILHTWFYTRKIFHQMKS